MGKIGIYIPDDQMPAIEKWQKELNLSEIFRRAFYREVAIRESTSKIGDKVVRDLVERLKREETESYENGRQLGKTDGNKWAKASASLRVFRQVFEEEGFDDDALYGLLDDDYSFFEEEYLENAAESAGVDCETFRRGYLSGFREGMREVWIAVRGKL
ncbi:MAG TPA: hypothetical protein DD670_13820 [Planctomycetaceae bacterium]|nr:hypothetical protein [Planctomycetaceae bacterium]